MQWAGRKFPKHFGPDHVAMAEAKFDKWGMWAVFFGRFVALLRIFAGPLSRRAEDAVLEVPDRQRPRRHRLGRMGTTALIYSVGVVAESWLKRFSWLGLVAALLFGIGSFLLMKHRAKKAAAAREAAQTPVGATVD